MSPADDPKNTPVPASEPDKSAVLINDEPKIEEEPADTLADIEGLDFSEHHHRRWLMLVFYFVLALAVAVLVVIGGRFIYHKVHKTNTVAPAGNVPSNTTAPSTAPQAPNPPANQNQTNTNQGTSSSPSSGQTAQTPSQLPNNGPGDVVALFLGTALIVGGLHFIYQLRRAG